MGGIAICGSEKTIVWRDEEDPPALTYPIGASGAIVSDQLDDDEGSEFLCCFLAKDKRMVRTIDILCVLVLGLRSRLTSFTPAM